jgi:hypothetical protein
MRQVTPMMALRPQVRTFIDAAETLLSSEKPAVTLNADEIDMIQLYLKALTELAVNDGTILRSR